MGAWVLFALEAEGQNWIALEQNRLFEGGILSKPAKSPSAVKDISEIVAVSTLKHSKRVCSIAWSGPGSPELVLEVVPSSTVRQQFGKPQLLNNMWQQRVLQNWGETHKAGTAKPWFGPPLVCRVGGFLAALIGFLNSP